jgi:hypothetical protein
MYSSVQAWKPGKTGLVSEVDEAMLAVCCKLLTQLTWVGRKHWLLLILCFSLAFGLKKEQMSVIMAVETVN